MTDEDREAMRPVALSEIEFARTQFELGEYQRAILALQWCRTVNVPLPEWLAHEVERAMAFTWMHGGASGRGRAGGHKKRAQSAKLHMERYRIVAREFARQGHKNKAAACRAASKLLRQTDWRGEPREMKKSYERVAKRLKAIFRK